MPFSIVRNDITLMRTEAIVNTANREAVVGDGCDYAIHMAAGPELLLYRKEHVGTKKEGEAFLTPGFQLSAKYIFHAVSPLYRDGKSGEEEKLRACYQNSLKLAEAHKIKSIAFPLIASGQYAYPKEEALRIAADEISAFLQKYEMDVYLVVYDERSVELAGRLNAGLKAYIDSHYVSDETVGRRKNRRLFSFSGEERSSEKPVSAHTISAARKVKHSRNENAICSESAKISADADFFKADFDEAVSAAEETVCDELIFDEKHESKLAERMRHLSDTYSEYLMYLIADKGMENADVWKRAIVDKKIFSKIKNNPAYHPNKMTALCLCIGAQLNLDETKDLLARAGYALSPCDKTDIIFSYFIENGIYDMIELDIQLEEHGLQCIID